MSRQFSSKGGNGGRTTNQLQSSVTLTAQARAQAISRVARDVHQILHERRTRAQSIGSVYIPRMDVYDDPELPNIYVMFELPGITPDNISVQVVQGKLVVTGFRGSPLLEQLRRDKILGGHNQPARHVSTPLFKVKELSFGRFHRELPLPENCSREHIDAEMKDGMLTLSWPRVIPLAIQSSQ